MSGSYYPLHARLSEGDWRMAVSVVLSTARQLWRPTLLVPRSVRGLLDTILTSSLRDAKWNWILRFVQGRNGGKLPAIFLIGWDEPDRRCKWRKRLFYWFDLLIGAFPKEAIFTWSGWDYCSFWLGEWGRSELFLQNWMVKITQRRQHIYFRLICFARNGFRFFFQVEKKVLNKGSVSCEQVLELESCWRTEFNCTYPRLLHFFV